MYLNVEKALTEGGVPSQDYPWFYGASYSQTSTLQGDGTSCQVELTAVAGEFFRIHPMELVNGWYMNESDLMHDRIILSRQAAWDLFYSDQVAGMYVTLDGNYYLVAAVVDLESGTYNALAEGDTKRAWVFADGPGMDTEKGFTCLEMVVPQPVKSFATSTLQSALSSVLSEKQEITDNSGRFSLKNRWQVLKTIGTRGISNETVPYPYWENAARLTENALALRLVPEGILLGIPALTLLFLLLCWNHRRTWGLHSIWEFGAALVDRKHQRDYAAKQGLTVPKSRKHRKTEKALEEAPEGPEALEAPASTEASEASEE
jgi:hypothetical protein